MSSTALPPGDATPEIASVQVNTRPTPGQNIRRAGEDVALGDVVLYRGQRLGPAELGLAASIGMAELPVSCRPSSTTVATPCRTVDASPAAMTMAM